MVRRDYCGRERVDTGVLCLHKLEYHFFLLFCVHMKPQDVKDCKLILLSTLSSLLSPPSPSTNALDIVQSYIGPILNRVIDDLIPLARVKESGQGLLNPLLYALKVSGI